MDEARDKEISAQAKPTAESTGDEIMEFLLSSAGKESLGESIGVSNSLLQDVVKSHDKEKQRLFVHAMRSIAEDPTLNMLASVVTLPNGIKTFKLFEVLAGPPTPAKMNALNLVILVIIDSWVLKAKKHQNKRRKDMTEKERADMEISPGYAFKKMNQLFKVFGDNGIQYGHKDFKGMKGSFRVIMNDNEQIYMAASAPPEVNNFAPEYSYKDNQLLLCYLFMRDLGLRPIEVSFHLLFFAFRINGTHRTTLFFFNYFFFNNRDTNSSFEIWIKFASKVDRLTADGCINSAHLASKSAASSPSLAPMSVKHKDMISSKTQAIHIRRMRRMNAT